MLSSLLTLIGRICLAMIFILSGISKIGGYAATITKMEQAGVPAAPFFLYASVLIELGAGICVATGFRARIASLLLVAFMLPVTYLFHFKAAYDPAMNLVDRNQLIQVLKNFAILGGLLLLYGNGAGKLTLGKDA